MIRLCLSAAIFLATAAAADPVRVGGTYMLHRDAEAR